MLSNVTWGEFVSVIVILLIIYYAIIGIKYFNKEIKSGLSGRLPKITKTDQTAESGRIDEPVIEDGSFDELETIVHDLRYAILERVGKSVDKGELLDQLNERLSQYQGLQKPAYRVAINNYIITNAKEICGVTFTTDELNATWDND